MFNVADKALLDTAVPAWLDEAKVAYDKYLKRLQEDDYTLNREQTESMVKLLGIGMHYLLCLKNWCVAREVADKK